MTQQNAVPRLLYSKRDAAEALGVSLRTIENFLATGELAARRVGRRTLVLASSVSDFAKQDHDSPAAGD
ncbi:MAG: helix-turn-helix domain-containing protein [Candidatus Acidiferrales bacterium]